MDKPDTLNAKQYQEIVKGHLRIDGGQLRQLVCGPLAWGKASEDLEKSRQIEPEKGYTWTNHYPRSCNLRSGFRNVRSA